MTDWTNELTPDEREGWEDFVDHFRRDALEKMTDSAAMISLVPKSGGFDVKFAVELGAGIMLDKPIIAVVMPDAEVPEKLRRVADAVIEADIDTEEGRDEVSKAIAQVFANLTEETTE
jgi:ABC-type nitrate/sulfonate/bicarbonate transport system substrate-binding protein